MSDRTVVWTVLAKFQKLYREADKADRSLEKLEKREKTLAKQSDKTSQSLEDAGKAAESGSRREVQANRTVEKSLGRLARARKQVEDQRKKEIANSDAVVRAKQVEAEANQSLEQAIKRLAIARKQADIVANKTNATERQRVEALARVERGLLAVERAQQRVVGSSQRLERVSAQVAKAMSGGSGGNSFFKQYRKDAGGAASAIAGLTMKMGLLLPIGGAVLSAVDLLVGAVAQLAGGAVALTSALAPVVGVLASIPQLALGAGTAIGTLILGFGGVGDAMKAYKKAQEAAKKPTKDVTKNMTAAQKAAYEYEQSLKALPKGTRDFVKYLVKLDPKLQQIKKTAANGLLPGVTEGLKSVMTLFPIVDRTVGSFAKTFGKSAADLGKALAGEKYSAQFSRVMNSNSRLAGMFSRSLTRVVLMFLTLTDRARPLTEWLGRSAENWIKLRKASVDAGAASGRTSKFFEKTKDVLSTLASIFGSVLGGLKNVGSVGYDTGKSLLDSIDDVAQRWEDWTGSLEGKSSMKAWFEQAEPGIRAIGDFLRELTNTIFDLGNNKSVKPFFDSLTDALPALEQLLSSLGDAAGSSLGDALKSIVEALQALTDNGGGKSLQVFMDTLVVVFDTIKKIAEVPGIGPAIGGIAAGFAAFKALKFASAITGISSLGKTIKRFYQNANSDNPSVIARTVTRRGRATSRKQAAEAAGDAAASGAITPLPGGRTERKANARKANRRARLKRVGKFGAAGAAIGGAAYLINKARPDGGGDGASGVSDYLQSGDALNDGLMAASVLPMFGIPGRGKGIKAKAAKAAQAGKGGVAKVGKTLGGVASKAKGFGGTIARIFSAVGPFLGRFVSGFASLATKVLPKILPMFRYLRVALAAISGPIGLIIAGITLLISGLVALYKNNETFRNFVNNAWASIKDMIGSVVDWLVNTAWPFVQKVFEGIGKVVSWLWTSVVQPTFKFILSQFMNVFGFLMKTAWPIVQFVFKAIATAVKVGFTIVRVAFELIWGLMKIVFGWLKTYAWPVVSQVFKWIADKANWLWKNGIKPAFDAVRTGVGKLVDAFKAVKEGVGKVWSGIVDKITGPLSTAISWINRNFIGTINNLLDKVGSSFRVPAIQFGNSGSGNKGRSTAGGQQKYAVGGRVNGHSPHAKADNIPAWLTAGEFVTRQQSTKSMERKHPGALEYINRYGTLPKYASGGFVGDITKFMSSPLEFAKSKIAGAAGGSAKMMKALITAITGQFGSAIGNTLKDKIAGLFDGDAGGGPAGKGMPWQALWGIVKGLVPGLQLTSAYRPGSITALGNVSMHARGRAIDVAPPSMSAFNTIKKAFPNAYQLFYSPADGQTLLRGKPWRMDPTTKAGHYDHIHLAMANGGKVPSAAGATEGVQAFHKGGYVRGVKPGASGSNRWVQGLNRLMMYDRTTGWNSGLTRRVKDYLGGKQIMPSKSVAPLWASRVLNYATSNRRNPSLSGLSKATDRGSGYMNFQRLIWLNAQQPSLFPKIRKMKTPSAKWLNKELGARSKERGDRLYSLQNTLGFGRDGTKLDRTVAAGTEYEAVRHALYHALKQPHNDYLARPWSPRSLAEITTRGQLEQNTRIAKFNKFLDLFSTWGLSDLVEEMMEKGFEEGLPLAESLSRSRVQATNYNSALRTRNQRTAANSVEASKLIGQINTSKSPIGIRDAARNLGVPDYAVVQLFEQLLEQKRLAPGSRTSRLSKEVAAFRSGTYYYATGGGVPGTGNKDTVPAMLTPGEFVIRKAAARMLGPQMLHALNNPQFFANGGPVYAPTPAGMTLPSSMTNAMRRAAASSGAAASVVNINTNIYNPVRETSTQSLHRMLRRKAVAGTFGDNSRIAVVKEG